MRTMRQGEAARAEITERAQVHSTVLMRHNKTRAAAAAAAAGVFAVLLLVLFGVLLFLF